MTGEGILLVGASGLAREVLAAGISGVVGILDDDPSLAGTEISGVPVLGPVSSAANSNNALLVCVGPSVGRRGVVQRLESLGVGRERYATFVADGARIGTTSTVGAGSTVLDGVVVTADAVLGEHVVVMPNSTITHDDQVGDFATLAAGVALGGGVRVGKAAYLGMNVSGHPGVEIGAESVIGMGAVVLEDVPPRETWAGVPARKLEEKV